MTNDIEARLAALERSNKRYRKGLITALCLGVAWTLYGFGGAQEKVPDVIKAHKFQVVDAQNKTMATMDILDGSGVLTTYNSAGNILVDIIETKGGAGGMVVYDGKKKQNLVITDVTDGGGSIRINNGSDQAVVSLGRNANFAGSVTIMNKFGKTIMLATGDTIEAGAVLTYDADGNKVARLPADK